MRSSAVCALVVLVACGTSESSGTPDPQPPPVPSSSTTASAPPVVSSSSCTSPEVVARLSKCLDDGGAPKTCAATLGASACDVDGDGLDDSLEDAMIKSYAPVFAFNQGNGSHTNGDSEPHFPTNAEHYAAHSTLYWRVDGDDKTKKVVAERPSLEKLPTVTFEVDGSIKRASSPVLGEGPNFWLCVDKKDGKYPDEALVSSMEASRTLEGGIDVYAVAHPTGKDRSGGYVVLAYMVYYAYNKFTLDDHEGDFEGGAVFVSLETGKVVALYADRHDTADSIRLMHLAEGTDVFPERDPSADKPLYNVCDDTTKTSSRAGVRFWDFATTKHHPVIYVAAGGHASYAYPGATKITGAGCIEQTIIRDVHNGEGPKLALAEDGYFTGWDKSAKKPVEKGVRFRNLGELGKLREAWTAFRGQWGCTLAAIPKSYPGPWDNERLCRHWLTNDWGNAPPFARATTKACK